MSKSNGITWVSDSREGAPIVQRLRDEGLAVDYFVADPHYAKCFDGIIPRLTLAGLKNSLKKNDTVIFDINKPNDKKPDALKLLNYFGCKTNSEGVFGPIADKLRRDHQVICGGSYADHLEFDRMAGIALAKRLGLEVSEAKEFKTLADGIKFLTGKDQCYVLKLNNNVDLSLTYVEDDPGELIAKMQGELPGRLGNKPIEFILQEKVAGVEISTEAWFDGEDFVCWNHTLEDKRFLVGNLGINTGCQSNTTWMKEDEEGYLVKDMSKLKSYLRAADYVGCIDVNTIIGEEDGLPYFLEFTPRFGYSAIYCLLTLIPEGGLGNFFLNGFKFIPKAQYACSQVISIPPYPSCSATDLGKMAKDVGMKNKLSQLGDMWLQDVYQDDKGDLRCAGTDGLIGVMTATGDTLEEATGQMYKNIDKLKIYSDYQYRTDHLKSHTERLKDLKALGVNIS